MSGPILPRSLRAKPPVSVLVIRWIVFLSIVSLMLFAFVKLVSFGAGFFSSDPASVAPSNSASPTKSEPETARTRCQDKDIVLRMELSESEISTDQEVVLTAYLTSISTENCFRDVGASANEIAVFNADGSKIWSSNRCPVNRKQNLVTLQPGDILKFTVPWYGYKNSKVCGEEAKPAQPGEVNVVGYNGKVESEPATLTVIK